MQNLNPYPFLLALPIFTLVQVSVAQIHEPDPEDPISDQLSLEELYRLPLIKIATGTAVPLEKAPSVASVISAEDIEAMGAITLDEVLESVPGLHAGPSTLNSDTVYSIRGIRTGLTPQVLIMLNGHRISSDLFSSSLAYRSAINVKNISRIEVIRGPGSAIYGADAYSGVINIITKSAKELDGFQVGIKGGSHQTKNLWLQYGSEIAQDWEIVFNFEHAQQDADKSQTVLSDQQSNLDPIANQLGFPSASLAPGYLDNRYKTTSYNIHLSNPHWKLGFDGWNTRDVGTGSGIAQALDHEGYNDNDQYLFSLEYQNNHWLEYWKLNAKFSYQYVHGQYYLNIFPPGTVLPIGSDGNIDNPLSPLNPPVGFVLFPDGLKGNPSRRSKIPQFDITTLYDGIKGHLLRFNMGIKNERFDADEEKNFGPGVIDGTVSPIDGELTDVGSTPYSYAKDANRSVKWLSIQDVWEINVDWTLTAGIRLDHYSDFGATTNPRLALVWSASDDIVAKILYGSAFRAPSFSELHAQNNPVGLGNPNLKPEKIDTLEIATLWNPLSNISASVSFYHFKAKDMIDFVTQADGFAMTQNESRLAGKGIELEANWKPTRNWELKANYAYQDTRNKNTDTQQAYVPKQQFYLDVRWRFKSDWLAALQLNWQSDRKREEGDLRKDIDDYALVNFSLRRKHLAKHWDMALIVKNLFNERVIEPSNGAIANDYDLGERSAYFEIAYHY